MTDKRREDFEKWAKDENFDLRPSIAVGHYFDMHTEFAFRGYCAALDSQQAEPLTEAQILERVQYWCSHVNDSHEPVFTRDGILGFANACRSASPTAEPESAGELSDERKALLDYFTGCAPSGIDVAGGEESACMDREHAAMCERLRAALEADIRRPPPDKPELSDAQIDDTHELHDHLKGAEYRRTVARSFYARGWFDRHPAGASAEKPVDAGLRNALRCLECASQFAANRGMAVTRDWIRGWDACIDYVGAVLAESITR